MDKLIWMNGVNNTKEDKILRYLTYLESCIKDG